MNSDRPDFALRAVEPGGPESPVVKPATQTSSESQAALSAEHPAAEHPATPQGAAPAEAQAEAQSRAAAESETQAQSKSEAGPQVSAKSGGDARALLQRLQGEFAVFRDCKPLALRIDATIRERFPELDRKALRSAMHTHTASTRYLKAVERSAQRFNLDGEPAGEVTDEQRAHASATLKERFAAQAKRQRENRAAEEAERRREEAERRRAEKLENLVNRFNR